MTDEATSATRRLPLIIGGIGVVVGAAVGLWPRGEAETTPPPTPSATASVSATATTTAVVQDVPVPAFVEPDLGGPDVGEVVVASATDAAGLVVTDAGLWWLSTEGATLSRSRADGGEPSIVFSPKKADAVGGALAAGKDHIFFSVTDEEAIYRVGVQGGQPEVFVSTSSPELVLVSGDELWWVDDSAVWRSPMAEKKPRRVDRLRGTPTSFAAGSNAVAWLVAPLNRGARHELGGVIDGDLRYAELDAAERDSLALGKDVVFWAESRPTATGDHGHLVRFATGDRPQTLRVSGLISHIARLKGRLVWTEIYVDQETSLLFSAGEDGSDVVRHGRVPGFVTALTTHGDHIYWSGSRGIERLTVAAKK